ncbi:MAG: acyl-CoA dehydrogenase family protein [Thermoplasmata archaeon]
MKLEFKEEHELIRQTVRAYCEEKVAPIAREHDAASTFPRETIAGLAELGMLGLVVPPEYGGNEVDMLSLAIAIEEIARVDGGHALSVSAHNGLCTSHLVMAASEELKAHYLPRLAAGDYMGAWALTEPGSGSDATSMRTRAVRDGDEWVLNGAKSLCTNANYAGVLVVMARTEGERGSQGISAFAIEPDTPGLTIGQDEDKLGVRASPAAPISLEDCRVSESALVGELHNAFPDVLRVLDGGRIGIGAMAVGLAQGALDASLRYALDRESFGQPIYDFQAIQFMLADMATQLEAARLLVYRSAHRKQAGLPFKKEAAMGKLYASEAAMRITTKAVQIHGGYGYIKDFPVERMFRDAKLTEIGEGTSEVQRLVIAREILRSSDPTS